MSAPKDLVRNSHETAPQWCAFAVWWVCLLAAWIVLVDSVAREELVLGAAAAAIAAVIASTVQRRGYLRFQPRLRWLLQVPRLTWTVLGDCALLGGALWRCVVGRERVEGRAFRVPFDYGGENGRDGARRALVNLSISLTPNSFVIDIDPESSSLLVHQLVERPLDPVLQHQQARARARGIGGPE